MTLAAILAAGIDAGRKMPPLTQEQADRCHALTAPHTRTAQATSQAA